MLVAFRAMQESAGSLARFLNVALGWKADELEQLVDARVLEEMERLELREAKLDYAGVRLEELANRACRREPPFEAGDTEKGFRDGLILETIRQFAATCS